MTEFGYDDDDILIHLSEEEGYLVDGPEGYEFGFVPAHNPEFGSVWHIYVRNTPIQDHDYNNWWPYQITITSRYNSGVIKEDTYGPTEHESPLLVAQAINRDILPDIDNAFYGRWSND